MRYVYIDRLLILIPKLVFLRLHELRGISFDFSFAPNLPNSLQVYCADVGYLVDGTDLACAGNNFAKVATTTAPAVPPTPVQTVAGDTTVAAGFVSNAEALHGVSFSYSMQKDAYADLEFLNDVGYVAVG